jgi:hypothetical protein
MIDNLKGRVASLILFLVIILSLLFVSCNRSTSLISSSKEQYNNEVLSAIAKEYLSFTTLSAKVKVESSLFDKKNVLKGQVRIKKDSIIWISLNLSTGFPIAKAVFKSDSFMVNDRVNKMYYHGTYKQFDEQFGFPLTYEAIQTTMLNEIASGKDGLYEIRELNYRGMESYNIQSLTGENGLSTYIVDKEKHKVRNSHILFEESIVDVNYSSFEKQGETNFPLFLNTIIRNSKKEIEFDIELSRLQIDKKLKFNFKVPKKYTR